MRHDPNFFLDWMHWNSCVSYFAFAFSFRNNRILVHTLCVDDDVCAFLSELGIDDNVVEPLHLTGMANGARLFEAVAAESKAPLETLLSSLSDAQLLVVRHGVTLLRNMQRHAEQFGATTMSASTTSPVPRARADSETSTFVSLLRFWAIAAVIVFKLILTYLAIFIVINLRNNVFVHF